MKLCGESLVIRDVPTSTSVKLLKSQVIDMWNEKELNCEEFDIATRSLRVIFQGKMMNDNDKVGQYVNDRSAHLFQTTSDNLRVVVFHVVFQERAETSIVEETAEETDDLKPLRESSTTNEVGFGLSECCTIL